MLSFTNCSKKALLPIKTQSEKKSLFDDEIDFFKKEILTNLYDQQSSDKSIPW